MAQVDLIDVSKVYAGNIDAVKSVTMHVHDKEFVVLVGPSGCGKSTTLRMVAGLEEVTSGEIRIDGKVVNHVPPKNRDIAMVFQNYALYPHMTVYQNLEFGLKLRGYPKKEIDRRVRDAAEILDISSLLQRKPRALSGGQRQRVAVGRAIVRKPKVFLFDEPLSNLDAKLRVQMRTELSKLHTRLQATIIYVTHDQTEALTMGDRIIVMKDGLVQQVADPIEIYQNPVNKFVGGFIGSPPMNFIEGQIQADNGKCYFVRESMKLRLLEATHEKIQPYHNKKVVLGVRPENIYDRLFAQDASDDFTVKAQVEVVEPTGSEVYLYLKSGAAQFIARVPPNDTVRENQDLQVVFDMSRVHLFDADTEKSIL